jgi:NTE family protein
MELTPSGRSAGRPVALALGGGGARGLAHAGVLRALEEKDYRVEAVAGCSMGGIMGALLGSGLESAGIVDILEHIRARELLDFGAHGGLIGGKGIERLLTSHVRKTFEELDIPLKVTAVDVQRGTLVVLGHGALVPALRATSALPGILSPVEHLGRVLIDGGLLNNLPIDVVRTMSLAPVLAVDVAAPPNRHLDFDEKRGLIAAVKRLGNREFRNLTMELFMKSFDVPQRFITDTRLAMDPPEILVRPDLPVEFGVEDAHRWEEAVEIGYRATRAALERWEAASGTASG